MFRCSLGRNIPLIFNDFNSCSTKKASNVSHALGRRLSPTFGSAANRSNCVNEYRLLFGGKGSLLARSIVSCRDMSTEKSKMSGDDMGSRKFTSGSGETGAGDSKVQPASSDRVEATLCKENELKNGEMKEFTVEGAKILLVKDNGNFYAVGGKCTHYGAPLAKGAYSNGFVRCPWHGACFNVDTGDIEDFPGLDSLPRFQVKIERGEVKLVTSMKELAQSKRVKSMCPSNANLAQEDVVVIIGGGASGASCAESLRQNQFAGRIIMITQETALPYDRPKLSKAPDSGAEALQLRTKEFYEKNGIELRLGQPVASVDCKQKLVLLADTTTQRYKYLVVATGGTPRTLSYPGSDLKNIFYLRSPIDGKSIAAAVPGKHVVIVGTSFIGMELASWAASKKPASVTVIGQSTAPYINVFGAEIGNALKKLFVDHGVKFVMPVEIDKLVGDGNGNLKSVVLTNGTVVNADILIAGIGVTPATNFLRGSGIETDHQGYIEVNSCMRTNDPYAYVCGDIVRFPLSSFGDRVVNVQHWQMALKHGKTAGQAIAGKPEPIRTVPFFWTVLFGKSLRYTGYGVGYDKIFIRGSLDELKFVAYFLKKQQLIAVASLGRDPVAAQIAECFRSGRSISFNDIEKNEQDDWSPRLI